MSKSNIIFNPKVDDNSTCIIGDLMDLLNLGRVTVWKWAKTGRLPAPLAIPNRSANDPLMWRVGDIRKWALEVGLVKDKVWDKSGDRKSVV